MTMGNDVRHGSRSLTELMERGSTEYRRQSIECPADLSVWTKLYAANQTMLSAMGQQRVSAALVEICSNLLGCEELAIIEIDRATGNVHFLTAEGLPKGKKEIITNAARQLELRISPGSPQVLLDTEDESESDLGSSGISAIVPLWADDRSSGALTLFQLLPQRSGFDGEDREVLQLLSIYAGPCLRSQKRD
jgi:hypothetical protein